MRRWCNNCQKIVYSEVCDQCGAKTQEDVPVEIYWCSHCRVPILLETVVGKEAGSAICPVCKNNIEYLCKDLRPVFPEERLLLGIIEETPLKLIAKSVWADGSRYFVDGKWVNLGIERLKKLDINKISQQLEEYKDRNSYCEFEKNIRIFIQANQDRLQLIKEEAFQFVREQAQKFADHKLVISFSGGKDSTVVADIVTRALADPSIVHIFGDTTLEFPTTYSYVERYRKSNPRAIIKRAKNKEQDFYSVCDIIGPPARMMRWCCTMFKTGPITRVLTSMFRDSKVLTFYGIRKHESVSRSKYDRVANSASVKIQRQTVAAPIFYWIDAEVWLYLLGENVDFNEAYRLGYDRVGCWCCPNNTLRSQLLAQLYMPEQFRRWREYLISFAQKIGKLDAEAYVDDGKWKARQGGNGLAAAEDVKIRYTNCTAEDHAKIYRLNKPIADDFWGLFVPFGNVSSELGRKLLHEVIVLDIKTNTPILSIQPFTQDGFQFAAKVRTMNVNDHDALQRMVAYQIRKYNACKRCLKCESVCPFGAISVTTEHYKIDAEKCRHCRKCVTNKYLDGGCLMEKFLKTKEGVSDEDQSS